MKYLFDTIRIRRTNFIELVNSLNVDELNYIPQGFNNNIIWNFGHLLATQQILCYKFSGKDMQLDQHLVESYMRGTKPTAWVSEAEVERIKFLLMEKIGILENDYTSGTFKTYEPILTSFGFHITNIDEAIANSAVHDGLHLGYATAMKRVLKLQMASGQ